MLMIVPLMIWSTATFIASHAWRSDRSIPDSTAATRAIRSARVIPNTGPGRARCGAEEARRGHADHPPDERRGEHHPLDPDVHDPGPLAHHPAQPGERNRDRDADGAVRDELDVLDDVADELDEETQDRDRSERADELVHQRTPSVPYERVIVWVVPRPALTLRRRNTRRTTLFATRN